MPKYKADIVPKAGGASHRAYVESDDRWSAEALLKLQYPDCQVLWIEEVEQPSTSSEASTTASDGGTSSSREFLGILLAVAIGAPVIHWVRQTFYDDAPPASVAADVAEAVPGQMDTPLPPATDAADAPLEAAVPEVESPPAEVSVEPAPPPEAPQPTAPKLQSFSVIVQTPDGAEATLAISARDEEHALQIVRDFRGNPPVVRVAQP